ncbi:hypothetical protein SteCoe_14335 [Stentor coeruleus]|uniref:KHDC4/BBP-like KH-domain type I domain-containing protein n=1 Tax=Stentor coeruleus TaxID=5963 RepID=A0A1R2C690_9CILI|nr:hypothetical protein SteCoe_14335 [Stentor coeruleus]
MSNYQKGTKKSVRDLIKDQNLRDSIIEEMMNQDLPMEGSLKIEINSENGENYQLCHEDLNKVLSFYGELSDFKLQNNVAFVTFCDPVSAYFAQKTLNNKYLSFVSCYLLVSYETCQNAYMTEPNAKYTCRFEIQIENDKDFQVARRLIGPKGNNMKKIGEICSKGLGNGKMHDFVKLRLRGKGSGFKEGATKEESNENLHLCVSSKYPDKYKIACDEISKLILQVYKDYFNFCRNRGLRTEILRLKKYESIQE